MVKCIEKLVEEIYNNAQIPFQLTIDGIGDYVSPKFDNNKDIIEKIFYFNNIKCCIVVSAAFNVTLRLLEFCILEKLGDIFLKKENTISLLLNGTSVDEAIIKANIPVILYKFNLINIYIENYKDEVLSYIKQCYLDTGIEVIVYRKNIIMLGQFEEILEHVQSIKEMIYGLVSGKCYISYCEVNGYSELLKKYNDTIDKINLAIKYNISESIFDSNKLLLEGIIDSVDAKIKENIFNIFKNGISKMDNEMIRTIEVFFKCDLNISEAAKELYIHRNTLIYRLDKIEKYTLHDIREFNNAILIKFALFIWKEKNENI